MIIAASVAVDVKHPRAKKEYTYLVPEELAFSINIGDLVCVPFNNIKVSGVVTDLFDSIEKTSDYKLKEVISKEAVSLSAELVDLSRILAKYYGTPVIDFLRLMLPPKVSTKKESVYSICSTDKVISSRAFNQKQVLEFIINNGNVTVNDISENLKITISSIRSALTALTKKGIIKREYRVIRRKPMIISGENNNGHINLTLEQQNAVATITEGFRNAKKTTLIYGVTGSGKTEVYIRAIERVLNKGKNALILVPEISLTPQMLSIFRRRFPGKTAVIHSRLSPGERFDEWQRIFSPIQDLGMIIIDEEHETSYKNGEHPYYDARTVAKFRAKKQDAMLVLGSATPSVESFYRVAKGEYSLVKLTSKFSPLATL